MSDADLEKIIAENYKKKGLYGYSTKYGAEKVREYAENYSKNQDEIRAQATAFGSVILDNAEISDEYKQYANTFLGEEYIKNLIEKIRRSMKKILN